MRNILLILSIFCSGNIYMQSMHNDLYGTLEYLETLSSYGDYKSEDDDSKSSVDQGLYWAKYWSAKDLDSNILSEFFYHSGRLYLKKKIADSSRIDLERSLNYNIMNVRALDRLGVLSTFHLKHYTPRKGYINRCVEAYKKKLKTDSSVACDWQNLAEAYHMQTLYNSVQNNKLVASCYRKCIQLDSANPVYYYELAQYVAGKEKEDALRKAISIKEFWLYRSHLIALYAYEYKKYKESIALIDETIAIYEKEIPVNNDFMGTLYFFKAQVYKSQKKMDLYKVNLARYKVYAEM
jgi:hypothetical protein